MYNILRAEEKDLQEILELQYIAFKSEAEMIGSTEIPALKQTYEDVMSDYSKSVIFKVCVDGKIIGSVRAFDMGEYVEVGKLMVHPDYRRRGIAAELLLAAEKLFPNREMELYTCTKSLCNISLYESVGYKQYKTTHGGGLDFAYFRKEPKHI